jgi:putative transcriptional regulator
MTGAAIMNDGVLKNNLRVLRAKHDISQEGLAEKTGVTRVTINSIENGKWVPSTVLALRIARVLGATFEEVFWLAEVQTTYEQGFGPVHRGRESSGTQAQKKGE